MTAPAPQRLWERVERWRGHRPTSARLPQLHRLTREDLDDEAVRAATIVALAGLGTDRLDALLDLRDALAGGALDEWVDAWARGAV
ncbi:hypothetical protein GTQ99_14770 [Kineococcus sp. T13]|uniref:hypothetical protein n=1 Tax=Kineococcus vitellinus TaxID=2696565 RepID=UPI0014132BBF|nr:hypothetical protein [Kineococcus vitellinus]NAZ76672.1 hypothetical protein [Kineococcus vitellinus]